jgi:hypothetical protein
LISAILFLIIKYMQQLDGIMVHGPRRALLSTFRPVN